MTVAAPQNLVVNLDVSISPNTTAMQTAVQSAINNYIVENGYPGGTIYLSKLNEAVANVSGIVDNAITSPTANIAVGSNQLATLGTITWV